METQIRLRREDPALVAAVVAAGGKAKLVRGGTILWPMPDGSLPPGLESFPPPLVLVDSEHGGGLSNTGHAHIVCAIGGAALRPYLQGWRSCGRPHATFQAEEGLATVDVSRWHGVTAVVMREWQPAFPPVEKVLWEGRPEELPQTFGGYQAAMDAAVGKSWHYHCRDVHYSLSAPR